MTQSNNKGPFDAPQLENQTEQEAHVQVPQIKGNQNIKVLNLRWQEIRKWELNRLRIQEMHHNLAFMRQTVKQNKKTAIILRAKNDPIY